MTTYGLSLLHCHCVYGPDVGRCDELSVQKMAVETPFPSPYTDSQTHTNTHAVRWCCQCLLVMVWMHICVHTPVKAGHVPSENILGKLAT